MVNLSDNCVSTCNDVKNWNLAYAIYGLNSDSTKIEVLHTSNDMTYSTFLSYFPDDKCRWAVFHMVYTGDDVSQRTSVVFFSWTPDDSPVKQRMVYASAKSTLTSQITVDVSISAISKDEISYKSVLGTLKSK